MKKNDGTTPLKLLFASLSAILICTLLVFGYSLWSDVKNSQFEKLDKQNQTLATQTRDFFDAQTRLVVKTVQPSLFTPTVSRNDLAEILDYLLSASEKAAAITVSDAQSNLIINKGKDAPAEFTEGRNTLLRQVKASRTAQIGYLQRSGLLGEALLPFYVPILAEDKQVVAVITVFFRVQGQLSLVDQFIKPEGNTIWLLGEEGRVRMSYPASKGFVSDLFSWRLSDQTAAKIQYGLEPEHPTPNMELEVKGERVLANAGFVPEYQLITLNTYPVTNLATIWLERMRPIALSFVAFLFVAFVAYLIALRISRKTTEAKQTAEGNVYKLSKAIEQSPNSVVITDDRWQVEYANSHFDLTTSVQNAKDEATGQTITNYAPYSLLIEDLDKIREDLAISGTWFGERKTEYNNKWYAFSISHITNAGGQITHYVIVVQDVSNRKNAEEKLYKQANFDPLTGLPNRRKANENLTVLLQRAWKSQKKVAVLYLDIDNLKTINDTFGHMVGDQLLQMVASRLVKTCRSHAHVFHLSGDEFMAYMVYNTDLEIETLAESILKDSKTPILVAGKHIYVSVSIGISRYPEDDNDIVGLVKFADMALYEAKKAGRDQFSFFNRDLEHRLKRKSAVESELRQALEHGEIYMVYQSKNDIQSGKIIGFEALMRWQSKLLGAVSPVEFIEIAEETGVINELGEFALRQSCRDLLDLQECCERSQPLRMAVNLSVQQLNNEHIVETIAAIIKESGINPAHLELEITESLLAQSIDTLLPRLERLLELGLSLTIDDFGTGYSSLSYLTTFPVSTLKVDRAFVQDMASNEGNATLTRTIIAMAHALNMKVVAEGIEDDTQWNMLRELGCDIGQGYLFSKPISPADMQVLLETENLPEELDLTPTELK